MPRYWPPFFIGLLMLTYWASVIVMVFKTKREVGKAANFLPPEPVGRILRVLWYPLVAVWIGLPLRLAYVRTLDRLVWPLRPLFSIHHLAVAPMLVATVAFIATLVCWKRMGKSWRMGIDPNETTELIVQGPYAYVRHPIYSLSIILMLCTMLILPCPLMLAVGVLHIFFLLWEARREERYLAAIHGEPYVNYCRRVGRFMARFPS